MKLSQSTSRLLSTIVVLVTAGVIGIHYFVFGKPVHEHWWVEYALLVFAVYIFLAFMHEWTMYIPGTAYFPEHRGWRIATLLLAAFIYIWVTYTLFFRSN